MAQDQPRKRYVDGSKVQEHYAIIPTKQVASESAFNKLDDLQKKIYLLVMKTTIAMFLPDYTYEETVIETMVSTLCFKATEKCQESRDGKSYSKPIPTRRAKRAKHYQLWWSVKRFKRR